MLNIGNRRECFFDSYLIDEEKTTAEHRIHAPQRRETVMVHDAPWEGNGCDFYNMFYDNGIWRMYYLAWKMLSENDGIRVAYAESMDGIHWIKPNLGICEYKGSKENNLILDPSMHVGLNGQIDNFMVFRDDNPACAPERRYKATAYANIPTDGKDRWDTLQYYFSADGIHFTYGGQITDRGAFDTLNVAFWDKTRQKYFCYYRAFHKPGSTEITDELVEENIRDIRVISSDDFEHWSEPQLLDFGEAGDVPLYTNLVQPYYRAPHIYVGFPTRYIYRREWSDSFEQLCGKEKRLERMKYHERFGLTITDCVFISSRDTVNFHMEEEAFMRPQPEQPNNWLYGDCYPARCIMETPSDVPGTDPELSMFVGANHWMDGPAKLDRYTIRCDGFVSLHAGAKEKVIVTKPFVYDGEGLYINMETAALGYLYFAMIDEDGNRVESSEVFGNKIDRFVPFPDDTVRAWAGKLVTMEVRMKDADLYAIQFQ